jgi:hypothetical protein
METPPSTAKLLGIAALLFGVNQLLQWAVLFHTGGDWIEWCSFDCPWYGSVVDGYDYVPNSHGKKDAANWAFFPLFPLTATALKLVTGWDSFAALLVAGKALFFCALFAFIRFAVVWDNRINPWLAAAALALNPYSLYGNVGYSEPLYLLLTALAFHALHQSRYTASGAAGALLSAARPLGIVFAFAYALSIAKRWRGAGERRYAMTLGLMLAPAGLATFMTFLHLRTGDALAFSHVQVAWGRVPTAPWEHLRELHTDPVSLYYGANLLFALAAVVWLAARRHLGLAAFALVSSVIPLTTGFPAMPRYIWWQLPVLLVLTRLIGFRKLWIPYVPLATACLVAFYLGWLEGKPWLV